MNIHSLNFNPARCQGFSIVEFMIAITLGALIVASTIAVYVSNKSTFRIQEGLSRLQENARYANYFLNHEIRMTGYQGCASENFVTITNLVKDPTKVLLYDEPLQGFDGLSDSFSPTLPANLLNKSIAGSDIIEVRMASATNVQLRDDMNQTNNPILVYDRFDIHAGDTLMITNCVIGDIFIAGANTNATAITHTVTNNVSNSLSTAYMTDASIMRYSYYAFYIKNTGRRNSENQPIYALVRQDINGNEIEIAEGIERMRIEYGVDTNSDKGADRYQTATEVEAANNWNNVISVKINLLFATLENVNNKVQPYRFNGATITPTDRKLRREWESFINLRNRGLPS